MTARPAFGEFLAAARDHASVVAALRQTDRRRSYVQEVTDSLLRVITVMGRYLQDITAVPGDLRSGVPPPLTAWGRARSTARDALSNAAGQLLPHSATPRSPPPSVTCCAPSRSTPLCPAPSWTAANWSPAYMTR